MRVRQVMTRHPAVVTRADPIGQAAATMAEFEVGILPVVEDRESLRLRGVLTDRDITVRHVAWNHNDGCTVGDHMTSRNVVTVRADDDLRDVIGRMRKTGLRRIPVVDASRRVVGIVSRMDLEGAIDGPDGGPIRGDA